MVTHTPKTPENPHSRNKLHCIKSCNFISCFFAEFSIYLNNIQPDLVSNDSISPLTFIFLFNWTLYEKQSRIVFKGIYLEVFNENQQKHSNWNFWNEPTKDMKRPGWPKTLKIQISLTGKHDFKPFLDDFHLYSCKEAKSPPFMAPVQLKSLDKWIPKIIEFDWGHLFKLIRFDFWEFKAVSPSTAHLPSGKRNSLKNKLKS